MMKYLLTLALFLLPSWAMADDLRVTLNLGVGRDQVIFNLSTADSREFLSRWGRLPKSETMLPLNGNYNYSGVVLRDSNRNLEIRLFSGFGRSNDEGRSDEFRQLERFVLERAPLPLGPALVHALDEDVAQKAGESGVPPRTHDKGVDIVKGCQSRARNNHRLRAICLEERIRQNIDLKDYADALERYAQDRLK